MKTSSSRSKDIARELGKVGEENVYKALKEIDAKFLFNLYVPYNNSTSEIDVVMITSHNIYVIEVKNYCGVIWGKEEDEYWVSQKRKGTYTFYNPIKQNDTHIVALKQFVDMPMTNIVIFTDISKLNIKSNSIVIQTKDIKQKIEDLEKKSTNKIDVNNVYNELKCFEPTDNEVSEQHINDLTKRQTCNII